MMFNKKMLGSCCVGLALLQSGDVFCAQRPLELGNETSAKPTTAMEVKNAPQECAVTEMTGVSEEGQTSGGGKICQKSNFPTTSAVARDCDSWGYMSLELADFFFGKSESPRNAIPVKKNTTQECTVIEMPTFHEVSKSTEKATYVKKSDLKEHAPPRNARSVKINSILKDLPLEDKEIAAQFFLQAYVFPEMKETVERKQIQEVARIPTEVIFRKFAIPKMATPVKESQSPRKATPDKESAPQ